MRMNHKMLKVQMSMLFLAIELSIELISLISINKMRHLCLINKISSDVKAFFSRQVCPILITAIVLT